MRLSTKPNIQSWAVERITSLLKEGTKTVEIGCGRGEATLMLKERGLDIQCADVACWHEADRDITHTSGTDLNRKLPFPDESFEVAISFEVLEHIANPFNAVKEFSRILTLQGDLFLTIPNFWSIRSRWNFFWRGCINRSKVDDPIYCKNMREGGCPPHINTMPWPILKFALVSYGFQVKDLCGYQKAPGRQAQFWPLASLIWLLTKMAKKSKRRRYILDETNRWSILFGSRHVFIHARKVGVDE